MKVLIKKATIHHPDAESGAVRDILIEDGRITRIAKSISDGTATVITSPDLHVSPGWVDIGAQPGQPGYEHRETYASLAQAALAGGYTALAVFPRTSPPIHGRLEVEYVLNASQHLPVRLLPVGAVSFRLEGKDLTEMIDMSVAGAVAFADGRHMPLDAGLLTRALEYVMPFQGVIMNFPLNRNLTVEGQMHEGPVSASLGLTGIPDVAEEIIVQRDIQLLGYTGSRLHFHGISSAASLPYIQRARSKKQRLTCDVGAMHLLLEDRDVGDFDSHRKVLPPLRDEKSRKALIKGLRDGHIDHIASLHTPLEDEAKACEFTYAGFGSIGLESAFGAAHTALQDALELEAIVDKFCFGPRRILGLEVPAIARGHRAELTLFDPTIAWTYPGTRHSPATNDALAGQPLTGRVIGVVHGTHLAIN